MIRRHVVVTITCDIAHTVLLYHIYNVLNLVKLQKHNVVCEVLVVAVNVDYTLWCGCSDSHETWIPSCLLCGCSPFQFRKAPTWCREETEHWSRNWKVSLCSWVGNVLLASDFQIRLNSTFTNERKKGEDIRDLQESKEQAKQCIFSDLECRCTDSAVEASLNLVFVIGSGAHQHCTPSLAFPTLSDRSFHKRQTSFFSLTLLTFHFQVRNAHYPNLYKKRYVQRGSEN